jgi:hypothetical protein
MAQMMAGSVLQTQLSSPRRGRPGKIVLTDVVAKRQEE